MPFYSLQSGYHSPYVWNKYMAPRQDVFREAAGFTEKSHDIQCTLASNKGHEEEFNSESATNMELMTSRRRQYPDLVNSHHDFILGDYGGSFENVDSRAGLEERGESQWRPPRYSKSEMPERSGVNENGICEEEKERRRYSNPDVNIMLHSEFQNPWNEYTGPRQEVVREAAGFTERSHDIQCTLASNKGHEKEFNSDSATNREPAMQRRMKSLDLVHSHHDFSDDGENSDDVDSKAGSEERDESQWRPPRYSKSEGTPCCGVNENGICEGEWERRRHSIPDVNLMGRSIGKDNEDNISEYTLQFTWPQSCPQTRRDAAGSSPREYKSMDT